MDTLDAIARLKERIDMVRNQIDRHRQSMISLEGEAQRLAIALGVMEQLEASNEFGRAEEGSGAIHASAFQPSTTAAVLDRDDLEATFKVPFVYSDKPPRLNDNLMPPSTKHLIRSLFVTDEPFTRLDVLMFVKKRKPDANAGTVATTLSKLVSEGFLIRDQNLYKRKDGIASADDTGDTEDLLTTNPSSEEGTPNQAKVRLEGRES